MVTASLSLTAEQVQALRERHPYAADLSWLPDTVRADGWLTANVQFLEQERKRSAAAMLDLMGVLGVQHVASVEQAVDLLELALTVFAPPAGFSGTVTRDGPGTIRIENAECPVYRAFEDANWHTVTACPSWHRRRGWIEALGVRASDSVVGEKKWGDAACCSIIDVRGIGI
jgi:hypothetical protein